MMHGCKIKLKSVIVEICMYSTAQIQRLNDFQVNDGVHASILYFSWPIILILLFKC